jgi:hypothetical protein
MIAVGLDNKGDNPTKAAPFFEHPCKAPFRKMSLRQILRYKGNVLAAFIAPANKCMHILSSNEEQEHALSSGLPKAG